MNERSYLILDLVRSKVLDLNPTESILASCFFGLLAQSPIQYGGKPYYMADYKNVACYCSVLPDKVDTLRRLYKRLENIGLITLIKIDNHICFTPSQMLRDWGTVYKSAEAEINPVISEINPQKAEKNPVEAEKNPPYINIINNNINNSLKKDAKASKENPAGFSQDAFSGPDNSGERKTKASVIFGFTPEALDVRKQVLDKADKYFEKLVFPFDSEDFKREFYILLCQPKWRSCQKSFSAIQSNLTGLSKYPEEFARILIRETISKGWAALEYDSTPEKYEKWERQKGSVKTEAQRKKEYDEMMSFLNNDFD